MPKQYFDLKHASSRMPDLLRGQTWVTQVSGEALYTDDVPLPANALHAVLVKSTRPHAKITSVDPSAALQVAFRSTAVQNGRHYCQ